MVKVSDSSKMSNGFVGLSVLYAWLFIVFNYYSRLYSNILDYSIQSWDTLVVGGLRVWGSKLFLQPVCPWSVAAVIIVFNQWCSDFFSLLILHYSKHLFSNVGFLFFLKLAQNTKNIFQYHSMFIYLILF